jgi:hypothetical protein
MVVVMEVVAVGRTRDDGGQRSGLSWERPRCRRGATIKCRGVAVRVQNVGAQLRSHGRQVQDLLTCGEIMFLSGRLLFFFFYLFFFFFFLVVFVILLIPLAVFFFFNIPLIRRVGVFVLAGS